MLADCPTGMCWFKLVSLPVLILSVLYLENAVGFSLPPNSFLRPCGGSTAQKISMGWLDGFSNLLKNLRVDRSKFPARSWQSNEPPPSRRPQPQPQTQPEDVQGNEPITITVSAVADADAAIAAGNFSLAIWTASPSSFTFYYDHAESHLILAGRAVLTPVDRSGRAIGPPAPICAGQRASTPAGVAVRWEVLSPVTKRTTCREPFRMVANGWILQPPKRWDAWPADPSPAADPAAAAPPAGNHSRLRPG
jgi:uncharacterized cupin superfamily protein